MEIIQSVEFWAAALGGGVLVKLVDYLLPYVLNRKKNSAKDAADERENLRHDIEYLRGEIEVLRLEVEELRVGLRTKERELSTWQRKYWEKRLQLERILLHIKHNADHGLRVEVAQILQDCEEGEMVERGEQL